MNIFTNLLVAIGDDQGTLSIYNQTDTLQQSFQAHTSTIVRIKYLNNSNGYAATVSCDSTSKIWNTMTSPWTLVASYAYVQATYCYGFESAFGLEFIDAETVAVGQRDGLIQIWSITTGQILTTINVGNNGVYSLQLFTKNQGVTCLAAGLGSASINIYTTNTYTLLTSLTGHQYLVTDFASISTSNLLASSSLDATVRLWDLTTNTCKFTLVHPDEVYGLKLISTRVLASSSADLIMLWNIDDGTLIRTLTGHTGMIYWSFDLYDTQTLVSGSQDQKIKYWNWQTGECLSTVEISGSYLYALAVSRSVCK